MARAAFPLLLAALGAAAGMGAPASPERAPGAPRVLRVVIDGPITLGTAEHVEAALARARDERFEALLVELDTPGGELESTRKIVRGMLESPVPVLLWVGPAGARAGSAGVFLTLAADVAAMHPTSNIGAAHPVTGGGRDVEAEGGKDMARKVENDTAAFVRTIASARGRNADWAEKAVRESVSATAEEAVKERVVDFLAVDRQALLDQADGRTVRAKASPRVLRLRGAVVEDHLPSIRQRALMFIANPNVVAVLTLLGMLGLGIEFYHPGALFPGVAGGFCLFLVFVASQLIPVNVAAVLLLLAGAGLLLSEAFFVSHGLAGAAGGVCLVLGLLFFMNTAAPGQAVDPGALSISPWVIWPTPLALAGLFLYMGWKVARGRRAPPQLGAAALLGQAGKTLSEVGPGGGEIFLHGEYWKARSPVPLPAGARVRVVAVQGLVVTVEADPPMG